MADPLVGVRHKIERAKDHILQFKAERLTLQSDNPYSVVRKTNRKAKQVRWKVCVARGFELPPRLSLIVGDAVHNLRSALDHLACAAVSANGGEPTTRTDFPIWRTSETPTAAKLEALAAVKVKGASKPIIEAVGALQSYPGGDHQLLWELDYLDIADKHRAVLIVVGSYERFFIDMGAQMRSMFPDTDYVQNLPAAKIGFAPRREYRCPVYDGQILFGVPESEAKHYEETQFAFDIAFGEPGVLECERVLPKLTQLFEAVTSVVDALAPLLRSS